MLKALSAHFYPKKKKIISTPIEHHSVINTLDYLKTQGITVEYCAVDRRGRVLLPELEKKMDADTFLLCCVLANNETGVIQDIAAITRMAHQHDVLVLSDCVQALGKISIDVHQWGIDYASSAHCATSLSKAFFREAPFREAPSMARTLRGIVPLGFLDLRGEVNGIDRLSAPRRLLRPGCRHDSARF